MEVSGYNIILILLYHLQVLWWTLEIAQGYSVVELISVIMEVLATVNAW